MKDGFASLIAYRERGNTYEYFIQKRDMNAKRAPGQLALFGGKIEEGETENNAVLREIREELTYTCTPIYFWTYEFIESTLAVYSEEVGIDFESLIKVEEGEYGIFMTLAEVECASGMNPMAELAVLELDRMLMNRKAESGVRE